MMTGLVMSAVLAFAPGADADAFVAVGAGEERPVGRLVAFADATAELGGANQPVTVRDVVSLRRSGVPLPPHPRGAVLLTTTGDRIPGQFLGGRGQSLRFRPTFAEEEWAVPLAAVSVVWLVQPPADTPVDPARYSWLADVRKRDALRLRNGDTVTGTLDGFPADPPAFRFKPEIGDTRTVPLATAAAVAFNPALATSRRPKGAYAHAVMRDGTRLDVTDAVVNGGRLRGKTLFGAALDVPATDLVGLDVIRGKAVYLSELKPAKVEQAGFLGQPWPWAADRTVRGEPLRLLTDRGEETFDRGLGTHPRTVLTYTLDGKYRRFEAVVGLDAVSGRRGQAAVRILVDGREQDMPALRALTAGTAVPVRVSVVGAKEVTLVTDYGPAGDVQADVNWADARLVE